jgi:hypothetical protein
MEFLRGSVPVCGTFCYPPGAYCVNKPIFPKQFSAIDNELEQDVSAMQDSVLSVFASISVGALIIVGVHGMCMVSSPMFRRLGRHLHLATSFLTEVSMFLVLSQNIGKRGPQQYTIPVEYAYLPFLVRTA